MSAEQLAACTERFVGFVRQDDREAAHAYMKGLLREYPADCDLKLNAAGWVAVLQMTFPEDEGMSGQRKALYEAVYASGNAAQRQLAANALASIAIQEDRTEDARRYLEETEGRTEDAELLRIQLEQKTV